MSEPVQTEVVHAVVSVGGPQPLVERAVVHLVVLAGTARHEEDVRVRDVRERGLGGQAQPPDVVGDGTGALGGEDHLGAGQAGEHLVGADRVQCGEPVEEHDGDLHDSP